jgi:hypothetical protein
LQHLLFFVVPIPCVSILDLIGGRHICSGDAASPTARLGNYKMKHSSPLLFLLYINQDLVRA